MATITFSGLASGFDSSAIVDKMVSLELLPAQAYERRKTNANARLSILNDLVTKLKALKDKAKGLDTAGEARSFTASSSDESRIRVTATSAGTAGSYAVRVGNLARAETSRSSVFAADEAPGDGTVEITVGNGTPITVSYLATETLTDIAARINDEVDGVTASVLDTGAGRRLIVSSASTGAANALSFAETGAGLGMTEVVAAQDATATIDGTTVTRSTNVFDDVVPGVTFELVSATPAGAPDTTIGVNRNAGGVRDKVQGLVDAYNAVAKVVSNQLTYNGTIKGENTLFGDSALQALQRRLGSIVTTEYGTATARQVGITLNPDGTLKVDAAKLDKADPAVVEGLLSGGLSEALAGLADDYTAASTGVLSAKQTSIRSLLTGYDKQIDNIEDAAANLGDRLRKQFAALEQLMSQLQSQSTYLSSLFIG